jgi:hypothetical protein
MSLHDCYLQQYAAEIHFSHRKELGRHSLSKTCFACKQGRYNVESLSLVPLLKNSSLVVQKAYLDDPRRH